MKLRIPDGVSLPAQAKVEGELLKLLASSQRPLASSEVYRMLADTFMLAATQQVARRDTARLEPAWNWLVRRAMQRIEKEEGWACRPRCGQWSATGRGRIIQNARARSASKVVGVIEWDILAEANRK
jgi:hypothetical protein